MESQVIDSVQDDHSSLSSTPNGGSSGPGILFKLPFMRASAAINPRQDNDYNLTATSQSLHAIANQHKTRRRRGSLRKAALLGRGAQRERRDSKSLTIDTSQTTAFNPVATASSTSTTRGRDALGLEIPDFAPPASSRSHEISQASVDSHQLLTKVALDRTHPQPECPQKNSYNSTTDEEDTLQTAQPSRPTPSIDSVSSGSESYFAVRALAPRRRSFQQAKSPLSYSGISKKSLAPDSEWDYSETEWWGWVVLTATWLVFVIGMGSCLNVWKWAWDVGKTPWAPPELEDDPTLPIDGYYPALIILTGVMAWVWVVAAWVGMKYFRHAKISGD
ncbi:hypothetical protein E4U52_004943 [Claviceps spartinae]|nr:hypothetical protein E4U52_004943 [Claviceps spartinae]